LGSTESRPLDGFFLRSAHFHRCPARCPHRAGGNFRPGALRGSKRGDLDEAIAIANDTDFALTGGIYSRSPVHIERVKNELAVATFTSTVHHRLRS